jgi:hypothetical protein
MDGTDEHVNIVFIYIQSRLSQSSLFKRADIIEAA